jgi:cold shock CspA family protein
MNGKVKRLVSDKGFGFHRGGRWSGKYFFHQSAVHGRLVQRAPRRAGGDIR